MGRESVSITFALIAWFVLFGTVSGLSHSRPQDEVYQSPDSSPLSSQPTPRPDAVYKSIEQVRALYDVLNSTNETVDIGEFVNATRMFSRAMADRLSIPIRHFVIISQQRSGTVWLTSLLGSHPNILCPDNEPLHVEGTLESVYHQLEAKAHGKRIMTVGFNLMVNQIRNIHGPLDFSDVELVLYWRRNVMRQIISNEAMRATNVAHVDDVQGGSNLSEYKPFIDTGRLATNIEHRMTERCEVMKQLAGDYHKLHYEDLLGTSFDKEMGRLEAYLGMPEDHVSSTQVALHASSPLLSTVENSAEVRSWLSKSKYAYMLDDTRLLETDHIESSICM